MIATLRGYDHWRCTPPEEPEASTASVHVFVDTTDRDPTGRASWAYDIAIGAAEVSFVTRARLHWRALLAIVPALADASAVTLEVEHA